MRVRKNVSKLSSAERKALVNGLLWMKERESPEPSKSSNLYDHFVSTHNEGGAHNGIRFLYWHRAFLVLFEQKLQQTVHDHELLNSVSPEEAKRRAEAVTLPYWDWSTDRVLSRSGALGVPFTEDLLGGDGDRRDGNKVKTGAFVLPGWSCWNSQRSASIPLTRTLGKELSLPTLEDEAYVMEAEIFSGWPLDQSRGFTARLEGAFGREGPGTYMHGRVHRWVGGDMANLMVSPNDPVFWMVHSNVDRLWAKWMNDKAWTPEQDPSYLIGAQEEYVGDLWPTRWKPHPADLLNHHRLGYRYDDEESPRGANVRMVFIDLMARLLRGGKPLRVPPFNPPLPTPGGPTPVPGSGIVLSPPARNLIAGLAASELAGFVTDTKAQKDLFNAATRLLAPKSIRAHAAEVSASLAAAQGSSLGKPVKAEASAELHVAHGARPQKPIQRPTKKTARALSRKKR